MDCATDWLFKIVWSATTSLLNSALEARSGLTKISVAEIALPTLLNKHLLE
jgi:hypothetical protein